MRLRRKRRWGADHIGHELGLAASTVQPILRAEGLGRLDRGDRATNAEPVRRYQRDRPGELIHVDVKKIAGIPDGGGWQIHGRGYDGRAANARAMLATATSTPRSMTAPASSTPRSTTTRQAVTAAGFWHRAVAWFADHGITCERVITDNGSCYRSGLWHRACAETGTTVKKTRPRRPQTNGKVERFHRILLEEWAYIRPWTSERQRHAGYDAFIHFYNHHRSHGALGWQHPSAPSPPPGDNLPAEHS